MAVRKGAGGAWEADVDGSTYTFTKWGALQSLGVLSELSDIVGGPLANVLVNLNNGLRTELTTNVAATILSAMTGKLRANKDAVIAIFQALTSGEGVLCNGKQVLNFDRHYEDRLDHLFRVAYAGLEVQYGSFFAAARGFLEAAGQKAGDDSTQASVPSIG